MGCSAQQQEIFQTKATGDATVSAVLGLSRQPVKAGWKRNASVSRAQPGLDGWSGQGRVEEESVLSTSLHSLSPVALPYISISQVAGWTTSSGPGNSCVRTSLATWAPTSAAAWMLGGLDRLVHVLFLLPPRRSTGFQIHLCKIMEKWGLHPPRTS